MGLKDDLINAKVEAFKVQGKSEDDIDSSLGSAIELQSELEKEAIVNFLTECEFRVTQLNANIVLEDFQIPPQQADVLPQVMVSPGIPTVGSPTAQSTTAPGILQGGNNGVLTKAIDVSKNAGGLDSTGYVFIGSDPDSQGRFDVSDEDGQREYTTVKLIRDDIEDLL
jgi:hypothetical protein